jgi:hypothetical protein
VANIGLNAAVIEEDRVGQVRRLLFMLWGVAPRASRPPRVLVERPRGR